MSEDFTSLDTTLEAVWTRLENGPREKTAPANVVCLATNGGIGANARMVDFSPLMLNKNYRSGADETY